MTNKKLTKSDDQLLKKNKELNDRLEKALKALETLKRHKDKLKSEVTKRSAELKEANEGLRRDIIEINKSRSALQESENNLSAVYKTMSEGLAIHELVYNSSGEAVDYIIIDVNPAYEKITGLKKKNISGMMATDAYSVPEAPYIEIYEKVASTGIPTTFEAFFQPMDKHFHVSVFSPEKGKFATVFQDITERIRYAEALKESEERYHQMFYQHQAIGLLIEPETGAIIDANSAALSYYGYTYEQLCSLLITDINQLPPDEVEAERKKALTEQRNYFVFPHRLANGEIRWVEVYSSPLSGNGRRLLYSIIHDVTSRKNAEEALRSSEERFSKAFKNSPNAITLTRISDGKIIEGNESVYSLLGYTNEDVVGKTAMELGIWTDAADRRRLTQVLVTNGFIQNEDFILRKKDGTHVPVSLSASLITIGNDQCFLCSFIDLTERKKAEEALKISEGRFRLALKNAPISVAMQDRNLVYTWAYNQMPRRQEEILGKTDTDLFGPEDLEWINSLKKSILESGKEMNVEKWLTTNGKRLFLGIHYEPVFDSNGAITGIGAATIDLTERKLAEEALAFQSQLLSNVYDAVFSSDINFAITYWNKAAEKMFGWTKEEVLGKNSGELLKPKIEGSSRDKERSKLRDAGHWEGEVNYIRKDGTYFLVEVNSTILKNADGKDIGNVVIAHDITERKKSEEKLKKSEALYRAIGESIDYGIWICDADGKNTYASESYLKLVGLTQEQCSEFGWGDTLHPDDAERTMAAWKECSKTGNVWDIEHRFRGVDGKWHPILARGIPIRDEKGNITMWAGINLDISSIKQAQEDLRKSEEKFRNLIKYAPAVIYEMDTQGSKFLTVNDAMSRILGYSRDELFLLRPLDLLDEQGQVNFIARVRRRLKGEKIEDDIEYRVRKKDGGWIDTLITVGNITFSSDVPDSITVIAYDITERKKMEEALRESEKKFRELVKYAPTAIYELDFIKRKFITVNDAMCKLSGYSREELLSLDALDLLVSESKALFLSRIKSCLDGEKPDENVEYEVKAKDGRIINAVLNMKFSFNEEGIPVGAMVVGHDITARKRAEAELRESETKFLSLFNLSPLPMALSTVDDGIFRDVNESFVRDSGFTKEEIVGKTSADLNLFIDIDTREYIIKETRNKGTIYGVPCDFRLKNGKILHCLLSSSTLSINGIFYLLSTIQDVTDILMTKDALKESEERFRTLSENIPDMIVRFDKDLRLIYGNKAVTDRTNLPVDTMIGKTPKEYGAPSDSSEKWERVAREVLDTGKPRRIEHTNSWLDNTKVFDTLLVPEMDKNGDVSSVISIARDITEMKRAENILRNSEQRLKYHFENSPLAVVEWDRDFQIIQWSNEAERIFGLTRDETLGVRIDLLNIIYSEDLPKVEQTIERLVSGKELKVISQNRNITKTGEIKECIWYNSVLLDDNGEMNSVMSLVEDVTLLRSTEKELLESRESYKELVTNARTIIIKMDTSGRCTFVNEYALDFFGFNKEEMLGIPVINTIMPEKESTGRDLLEMAEEIIEDPDNFSVNINENIKKNGELVWVEWHNKALYDNSGIRTGHIGIGIDVTEKKKAEEALKENERKLWSVLDATQESIYMFDRNGIICMLNSTGVERLNKRSENEIIGHHFSEFMTPDVASARQEKLEQVFTRGIPLEFEDERDFRIFHHNYFPVFKENKVVFVVTYSTDITDQKRAESKLIESEDRFRTIAESLTIMISIIRICDSAITFANEPFEKTFGFGKDETQGNRYQDCFYNPSDFKNTVDILKDGGTIDNLEVMVKKADGTLFWIMLSIRKISFLNEPSYLAVSIDITESKTIQIELLRLNRILNAISKSSHAMMHSTNEFDYINEICRIIIEDCGHTMVWVGYAQNDESKSVVPVAFHGFENEYIDKLNISWADNERGRGPTGTAIRTGKVTMCKNMLTDPAFLPWREAAIQNGYASSLVFPLISEGKAFGAISIYSKEPDPFLEAEIKLLSDLVDDLAYGISFLRLAESERAATNAIKENEIKLKELIITKDKFFNIVAHDLKNPFTSLLGASELLYSNISEMTPENVRKLALILNDSAKGGYAILQNLLDWSRSQTGLIKFNPENINLKLLINENIENLQLQVTNKEINLRSELTEDMHICADQNMINTVLRNLLSNAVKYTFKNGTILVRVSRTAEEVVVSVRDSGIGITSDVLDNLFRLENSLSLPGTEKEKGTGLGLKLCKEFTEMMGGKIWVESTLGQGSEFSFTIPLSSVKYQEINSKPIKTI